MPTLLALIDTVARALLTASPRALSTGLASGTVSCTLQLDKCIAAQCDGLPHDAFTIVSEWAGG